MQRLRGSDAFAIYSESKTAPFETLKVAIYTSTDKVDRPGLDEVKRFVEDRISVTGAGRADFRIMRVPFDLHHPVWVHDPDFSPENHIHQAELPSPGGKEQLCEFLSKLMSRHLDPNRPLWEIWLLSGLEDGKIAIAFKVHHALADGKTIARMIEGAHTFTPPDGENAEDAAGEPIPGKSRLVGSALVDLARSYTVALPHFYHHLKQARQRNAEFARAMTDAVEGVVAPFTAPITLFNAPETGSDRIYCYETLSLADFKALSRNFDCTINTLVMGVCSEALKRYLQEVDDLPVESLVAAMPMGGQAGSGPQKMLNSDIQNNNLAVALLPLYQNIENFEQRLRAIKEAARVSIDYVRHADGRRFDNYLDFMPGTAVRLMHRAMNRRNRKRQNPHSNVIISNVPGPQKVLYALDGRLAMDELLSVGNLTDAGHLNITVWSYVDKLSFSFYIRKGVLPQAERIAGHLRDVVNEIRARYLAA